MRQQTDGIDQNEKGRIPKEENNRIIKIPYKLNYIFSYNYFSFWLRNTNKRYRSKTDISKFKFGKSLTVANIEIKLLSKPTAENALPRTKIKRLQIYHFLLRQLIGHRQIII